MIMIEYLQFKKNGMTSLHWAVKKDYHDVTIILLRAGSFPDRTDIVIYI